MRHASLLGALVTSAALVVPASEAQAPSGEACPSRTGRSIVRTLRLPGPPQQVLVRGGLVWVTLRRPGARARVVALDARTGRIEHRFLLEGSPARLAYGFGSLWIPEEIRGEPGGTLVRLDPRSGRVLARLRASKPRLFGAALAMTPDAVWIGGADTRLDTSSIFVIDPKRNAVARRLGVRGSTVVALAARGRTVWASGWESIVKLSPRGRVLFRQPIGGVAFSIALAPHGVWGAQQFFGHKYRKPQPLAKRLVRVLIAPKRLVVVPLDATPGIVVTAAGAAWVVFFPDQGRRAIVRVAGTPPRPEEVALGNVPSAIASVPDGVWVASHKPNVLWKIC